MTSPAAPKTRWPFQLWGPADFQQKVMQTLAQLFAAPSGKELLRLLNEQHDLLRIRPSLTPDENTLGVSDEDGVETIFWDSDTEASGIWHPTLSLGHELCHATRRGNPGGMDEERRTIGTRPPLDWTGKRVYDANGRPNGTHVRDRNGNLVPDPDYSGVVPSENSLRRDLGFPPRHAYNDLSIIPPGSPGEF